MKEAIRIQRIIQSKNFVQFFRILRSKETNYFFACIMLNYVEQMRLIGIETMFKSYRFKDFPLGLVKNKLNLSSEEDAESLISACGYYRQEPSANSLAWARNPDKE